MRRLISATPRPRAVAASHSLLSAQIYVESHLSNTATKFYGELTQQMLKLSDAPGSDNGTGFFQTLTALKLREIYEKITAKSTVSA